MRNITLIHGPAVRLSIDGRNLGAVRTHFPKISQLMLAAIIEKSFPEINVRIVDMKTLGNQEVKYKEIKYGSRTIEAYQVGLPFSAVADTIASSDALIFTNNFTQEAEVIGDLIEFAKQVNPNVKVWIGGSDAMVQRAEVDRQHYFHSRGADYVSAGDGELTLPDLIRGHLQKQTPILSDFDRVPDPALHLVNLADYTESHEGGLPAGVTPPLMYVETSRGCRQSCDFCSTPFTKGRYRYMSEGRIEHALAQFHQFGIRTLLLIEDNILSRLDLPDGRDEVLHWFRSMFEQGFVWEFANGVEIGKLEKGGVLDQELIEAMFQYDGRAGCYRSYIPLERIDSSELPYRKLKAFDVEKGILLSIAQQGVALLNLGVIIGNPAESHKSLSRTEDRMLELKDEILDLTGGRTYPFANFFLHIPICGTNDYRRFHKEGRLAFDIDTNPELYNFYTSILRGDNFSYDELTEIRKDMAARVNGQELMEIWNQGGKYYPDSFQEAPVDGLPLEFAVDPVLTSV